MIYSYLLYLQEKYFEVRKSKVHGMGIFAVKDISKNTNLGIAFYKNKNTGKPDLDYKRTKLGIYVNHSEKPNVYLKQNGKNFYIITTKNLNSKDEILIDYNDFPWEGKRSFAKRG